MPDFECWKNNIKIDHLCAALLALFSALHSCSIYQNFAFFMGQNIDWVLGLWFVANSRKIPENLKKWQIFGFSDLNTAATGQPVVQNWWNFGWRKFRPNPWRQAKNEVNSSNTAEMRGQKVKNTSGRLQCRGMHFPEFFWHFWKI